MSNEQVPDIGTPETKVQSETIIEKREQKRAVAMSRYIEKGVLAGFDAASALDPEELADIQKNVTTLSDFEKINALYGEILAYDDLRQARDRSDKAEVLEVDPSLRVRLQLLWNDEPTRTAFLDRFSKSREADAQVRNSALGKQYRNLVGELAALRDRYGAVQRELYTGGQSRPDKVRSLADKAERLAKRHFILEKQLTEIEKLQGRPMIKDYTDIAAMVSFEESVRYRKELDEKFVWTPTRTRLLEETVEVLQNGRWPMLMGEAGTGKSEIADAAIQMLTGAKALHIACTPRTNETSLIARQDDGPEGSYDKYMPVMRAFTGYDDSREAKPSHLVGRMVRLDEFNRLGETPYALIKEWRQLKPGDEFYGKKVLRGAAVIGTGNKPGPRYTDRRPMDAAMRREFAEIPVDYFEMTTDNPEIYLFLRAALEDKHHHITASKKDLAPAYEPDKSRIGEAVMDGDKNLGVITGAEKLISDPTNPKHGILYRLAYAVRALQDAYILGNESDAGAVKPDALRIKTDDTGAITLNRTDGDPLILSSSTITAGEINSWMAGWQTRTQKDLEQFHVKTLGQWIRYKLTLYIDSSDSEDRDNLRALFDHFHLLDQITDSVDLGQPLTPLEIGYLDPRVPRPLIIEKPEIVETPAAETEKPAGKPEAYSTKAIVLESGETVKIKTGACEFKTALSEKVAVAAGTRFMTDSETFLFAGQVDEADANQGKLVGSLESAQALHRLFTPEQVELGILKRQMADVKNDLDSFTASAKA